MIKRLLIAIFSLCLLFLGQRVVIAEGEFTVNTSIYYQVNENGSSQVTHYITLINNFTDFYAPHYSLQLSNIDPKTISAFSGQTTIPFDIETKENGLMIITLNFPDVVVGQGASREFSIRYTEASIAQKTGEVWEVRLPQLTSQSAFNDYNVTLSVPSTLGELAYVSPTPRSQMLENARHILTFNKEDMLGSLAVAAFGKFQVFTFDLTYHLENPLNHRSSIDLAVPPDTAYQKVLLEQMEPKPVTINKDEDGNWLAYYILNPREKVDVRVKGAVQIFADKLPFPTPTLEILEQNKQPSEVWQINDPAIKELAGQLKTPEAIYNYVSTTLKYNTERAKPNAPRLGALEALRNPTNSICMEFTDLFIALARAAGIPAREVNGFAYTENPESEPRSLVDDVLHAWPEYWDEQRGAWIAVDPTWGSTAKEDYFHKLDLRHFAFVHHGKNPYLPYPPGSYKLGPEPQKDIFVMFGELPIDRAPKPELRLAEVSSPIFKDMEIKAVVQNNGVSTWAQGKVDIYLDDKLYISQNIENLPPFALVDVPVKVPFHILGDKMPENVTIRMGDQVVNVATHKASITILNISIVFLLIFLILLFTIVRIRRIRFIKLQYAFTRIRNIFPKRISTK